MATISWVNQTIWAMLALLLPGIAGAQSARPAPPGITLFAAVQEWVGRDPGQPTFLLTIESAATYQCGGYTISHHVTSSLDTIRVATYGVLAPSPPTQLCDGGPAPALAEVRLPREKSHRILLVADGARTDTLDLIVTDETFQLKARNASFVAPDERLRLRYPERGLVAGCHPAGSFCDGFFRWLHNHPGISAHPMPTEGINPWWPDGNRQGSMTFQYASLEVLGSVFLCIDAIQVVIEPTMGMTLGVGTWAGEGRGAYSRRSSQDYSPSPTEFRVAACH